MRRIGQLSRLKGGPPTNRPRTLLRPPTTFAPIRGQHWTASARAYHWKAVRAAAGWGGSLYLATRHFAAAGWCMVNELDLLSEDVAIADMTQMQLVV